MRKRGGQEQPSKCLPSLHSTEKQEVKIFHSLVFSPLALSEKKKKKKKKHHAPRRDDEDGTLLGAYDRSTAAENSERGISCCRSRHAGEERLTGG